MVIKEPNSVSACGLPGQFGTLHLLYIAPRAKEIKKKGSAAEH